MNKLILYVLLVLFLALLLVSLVTYLSYSYVDIPARGLVTSITIAFVFTVLLYIALLNIWIYVNKTYITSSMRFVITTALSSDLVLPAYESSQLLQLLQYGAP